MKQTVARTAGSVRLQLCWAAVFLWLPVFWVSVAAPFGSTVAAVAGAGQGLLLVAIFVLHATLCHSWRAFFAYLLVATVVTFLLEACSIAYGFPFGYYVHHGAPGPAPLGVPISVMAGYVVLGWFAWTLARLLVCGGRSAAGPGRFLVPVVGAFILAGFDYPYDPIGSTVRGMWSFREPGGQYGVPLSNYLGWIFTGWAVFQLFSMVENRLGDTAKGGASVQLATTRFWAIPVIVWVGLATQYPVFYALAVDRSVELAGSRYSVADIFEASVAASLFTQVFVALLGLAALFSLRERQAGGAAVAAESGL